MATQRHHFDLFADYHQFYLQDELVDGNLGDSWTQEALDRLLAITDGTIGIGSAHASLPHLRDERRKLPLPRVDEGQRQEQQTLGREVETTQPGIENTAPHQT